MSKLMDPTPSDKKIKEKYLTLSKGRRPILLIATSEKYELTLKETLLFRLGLMSIKSIDRRQTRIARFNGIKTNVFYRIKKKGKIDPFFWKDPISLRPILFTSIGVVYKLSIIDRLMLKFNKTNIDQLNTKAVYGCKVNNIKSNFSPTRSKLENDDYMDHLNKYIRGYGEFFES